MHHLFAHAAAARITRSRTHRQILVSELAPYANYFDPLGLIRFYQEVIAHRKSPATKFPVYLRSARCWRQRAQEKHGLAPVARCTRKIASRQKRRAFLLASLVTLFVHEGRAYLLQLRLTIFTPVTVRCPCS